jgi:hypothetical protein
MTLKRLAPLSGILAVALFVVAFVIGGEPPNVDDPANEIVSFYSENDSDQIAASIVLAYGGLFFLFFATALRNALRRAEGGDAGASTLSFAGAILLVAGFGLWASFGFAIGDAADHVDQSALLALHALNFSFFFVNAIGLFAFLLGSGIAIVKTGALPKWLGWVAIVLGIVALIPPIGFGAFIGFVVWSAIVGVLMFIRLGTAAPAPAAAVP